MSHHRCIVVALALVAWFAAPAAADDNKNCSNGYSDRDGRIAACTRLINSRKLGGTALARVYGVRGFAFYLASDYDRAAADLSEAVRLHPKSDEYRIDRGRVYVRQRKFDLAFADFTEAIRLSPRSATGYMERGALHDRREDYDRAIADYGEAIRVEPSNYSPYFYRGSIYYWNKKDDPRAIADLTEAIRLNTTSTPSMIVRGRAFERQGHLDRALADFRQALSLDPKYGAAIEGVERVTKAMAARGTSPAAAPAPVAAPSPAPAPAPPVASISEADRAGCQSPDMQSADAIAACARLIASNVMAGSELAVVHLWRGMHHSRASDIASAMQDYNAALKLDPKLPSGYLFRAASLEFQGQLALALADYRMAALLDPNLKDAAAGAQRVELQLMGKGR